MVVNKWDLMDDAVRKAREEEIERRRRARKTGQAPNTMTTLSEFGEWVQEHLFFLDYAPVIFTSAKSGFHLDRLLEAVRYVAAQLQQKIPTAHSEPHVAGRGRAPPAGQRARPSAEVLLRDAGAGRRRRPSCCSSTATSSSRDQYKKYLADQMRAAFGYEGCPIVLVAETPPQDHRAGAQVQAPAAQNPGLSDSHPSATASGPQSSDFPCVSLAPC